MTGSTQVQEIRALTFSLALTVLFAGGVVVTVRLVVPSALRSRGRRPLLGFRDHEEMMLLHPDVDVAVLFRSVPVKSPSVTLPRPPAATA